MLSHESTGILMTVIFFIGYVFITLEHYTKINKATVALLMAICCWTLQYKDIAFSSSQNLTYLCEHVSSVSQVIFFLLGALAIVETINAHEGFSCISKMIKTTSKRKLFWLVGIIAFFLSSVLDNLTTTIVMISLLQKLVEEGEDRLIIGGGIVIAANAGGAWTPIGDVTTTMLWIGGQISTLRVMSALFLPSFACFVVAMGSLSIFLKGNFKQALSQESGALPVPYSMLVFVVGICSLIFVPVFKIITGLPPFMGILLALGVLWLLTDLLHRHYEERQHLRIPHVLTKIDLPCTLFFLGILLSVAALDTSGVLKSLAVSISNTFNHINIIAILIGLASAVVDNVPLVAATMSMYDLTQFSQDHPFWLLTAFAAGTGGSLLIIGSAAGVVFMGMEKVDFIWYFRKIAFSAALGFFAGFGVFLLQMALV
jgi:Na+/H+ antiporter NhaD/arsenite permease-like protein